MSGLLSICNYLSESEEDDSENICEPKRKKLPQPDLSKVSVIESSENHIDDPHQHDGRIRSFPHVRGNWATFVYISYPENEFIIELINKISNAVGQIGTFKKCDNLHVSLSRTVVLKYHWINSFVETFQSLLPNIESFELFFDSVKVYCNDERSRTFIALEVQHYSHKYLQALLEEVDKALEAYNLSKFYENPSFHMSILWIEGDKEREVNQHIGDIRSLLTSPKGDNTSLVLVDKVSCKVGNKCYQFSLQY